MSESPENYVQWTALPQLSDDITAFDQSPHTIVLGRNGDEISQTAFKNYVTKNSNGMVLSGGSKKIEAILLTLATNKARKTLGLKSLKQLRFDKNTENITVSRDSGGKFKTATGTAGGDIPMLSQKRYVFTYPSSHPFALTTDSNATTNSSGVEQWTTGVTRDSSANTLTIDLEDNFPQLYYYCTDHDTMGGAMSMRAPYQRDPDTVNMPGNTIFQTNLFNKLTVDDVKVDVSSIQVGEGLYFADADIKQAALDSLYYLPTVTNNKFNTNLVEFKKEQKAGRIYLDLEDSIDAVGNLESLEQEVGDQVISDAMAYGRGALPLGLSKEGVKRGRYGQTWYKKAVDEGDFSEWLKYNPTKVKAIVNDSTSLDEVSNQSIRTVQYYHGVLELSEFGEAAQKFDGIYYDDTFSILNIKDPAVSIDETTGTGRADLTRLQLVRRANIIHDDGIVALFGHAQLAPCDQPRGSVFLGDVIIAPPNSYIPSKYDSTPRLDLFCFGGGNQRIKPNDNADKVWNINLRARIKNDFVQAGIADFIVSSSRTQAQVDSLLDGLTLNWGSATILPSSISNDLFKLRGEDGKTKYSALQDENGDITDLPKYLECDVTHSNKTFKYRVLDSDVKLKISNFVQPKARLMTLDTYGYDVNYMDDSTRASRYNIFLVK